MQSCTQNRQSAAGYFLNKIFRAILFRYIHDKWNNTQRKRKHKLCTYTQQILRFYSDTNMLAQIKTRDKVSASIKKIAPKFSMNESLHQENPLKVTQIRKNIH